MISMDAPRFQLRRVKATPMLIFSYFHESLLGLAISNCSGGVLTAERTFNGDADPVATEETLSGEGDIAATKARIFRLTLP